MNYKTRIASTILGLGLVFTGSKANAILISDERTINEVLSSANPVYDSAAHNNSFNLTAQFTPGSQTISLAYASFSFYDVDFGADMVTIKLDSSLLTIGVASPIGFSAFGGAVGISVLADLNETGILDYTVTMSGSSTVTLKGASLLAVASAPVPDGGSTLVLLSCAMLGLGWARKKMNS